MASCHRHDKMETPILDMLNAAAGNARIRFCMPGHKGRAAFLSGEVDYLDLTEIPGVDNLHLPEGPIARSQQLYADAVGAAHAYYLVNGSTCGLQAALLSSLEPEDHIIAARDLHVSAASAFVLGGLEPYFIRPRKPDGTLPYVITPEEMEKAIAVNRDAKAVYVTYPNYYGLCVDLETISAMAHEAGMLMICDAAHAAAFDFSNKLPASPGQCGCDIWVMSLHKTLPAMNQCAVLCVSKDCPVPPGKIQNRLNWLQTTSPSFLLLGSCEYAASLMEAEGAVRLARTIGLVRDTIPRIEGLGGYKVSTAEIPYQTGAYDRDILRMIIDCSDRGLSGLAAQRELLKRGVAVEGADLSNLILICSIADTPDDYDRLVRALASVNGGMYSLEQPMTNAEVQDAFSSELEMPMRKAALEKTRTVRLEESAGRICAVSAGVFPPGVPVVLPGQRISDKAVRVLEYLRRRGFGTFGYGEYIHVVEET